MYNLILASTSPRRKNILENAGFIFSVVPVKISEIPNENLNTKEQVLDIARRKAVESVDSVKANHSEPFVLLTSDTEVIFDNRLMGKPNDDQHAFEILRKLSGNTHLVVTALYLIESTNHRHFSHIETSEVLFRELSDEEIWAYIATKDPFDKAGAYGVQSSGFVKEIRGSRKNVIGLPVEVLEKILVSANLEVQKISHPIYGLRNLLGDTQILAVSKLQSEDKIRDLYKFGQRQFGENYLQEALEKMDHLGDLNIEWHLIGRLQKNKIKFLPFKFKLIHSISSMEILSLLSKHCQLKNAQQKQDILIQVNIANETSKDGFLTSELKACWVEICKLPGLRVCGLMTMPPLEESAESVRPYFQALKNLYTELREMTDLNIHPMEELSMGTSHDYLVAKQEGSTIVRLGTILFGARPHP